MIRLSLTNPFSDWGEIFNDHPMDTAILDRLLHYSTTLNIKDESYRLKKKRKASLLGQPRMAWILPRIIVEVAIL